MGVKFSRNFMLSLYQNSLNILLFEPNQVLYILVMTALINKICFVIFVKVQTKPRFNIINEKYNLKNPESTRVKFKMFKYISWE